MTSQTILKTIRISHIILHNLFVQIQTTTDKTEISFASTLTNLDHSRHISQHDKTNCAEQFIYFFNNLDFSYSA